MLSLIENFSKIEIMVSHQSCVYFLFFANFDEKALFGANISPKPKNGRDLVEMLNINIRISNFWLGACLNDVSGDCKNMNIFVIRAFLQKMVMIFRTNFYLMLRFGYDGTFFVGIKTCFWNRRDKKQLSIFLNFENR